MIVIYTKKMSKHFDHQEFESEILEIISFYENRLNLRHLSTSSNLQEELEADDITRLEIFMEVADKFNIDKDTLIDGNVLTVGDIINVVSGELAKA